MSRSLRAADVIVLGMTVFGAMALLKPLGVTHPLAAWAVAMAWTCPAAWRLIAWRRQTRPVVRLSPENSLSSFALLLGLVVCALLWIVDDFAGVLWQPRLPGLIQQIGVVLVLCGVLRPLWRLRQTRPAPSSEGLIEGAGLLLVCGSPLLAALAACGLTMKLAASSFRLTLPAGAPLSRQHLSGPRVERPAFLPFS